MKILVTGGAGYIGSHTCQQLLLQNHELCIVDDLSSGFASAIPPTVKFYQLNLNQTQELRQIFKTEKFDAVLHFAASVVVPESVSNPAKYYKNNTFNTLQLLEICQDFKIKYFIFSSTAAVYGEPNNSIISESQLCNPINPYGHSKLFSEQMIYDFSRINPDFKFVILRYFNVAGASLDNSIGQSTKNATHLVKIAAECAANKRDAISIFGTNFNTPDGTCVRDYIHVVDLANAHLAALKYLQAGGKSDVFNCGYGKAYSVRDVINCMQEVSGVSFKINEQSARAGDPASLSANNSKIRDAFDWKPQYDDLKIICKTAYDWEKKLP